MATELFSTDRRTYRNDKENSNRSNGNRIVLYRDEHTEMTKIIAIGPMATELFSTDRRTDRNDKDNSNLSNGNRIVLYRQTSIQK